MAAHSEAKRDLREWALVMTTSGRTRDIYWFPISSTNLMFLPVPDIHLPNFSMLLGIK